MTKLQPQDFTKPVDPLLFLRWRKVHKATMISFFALLLVQLLCLAFDSGVYMQTGLTLGAAIIAISIAFYDLGLRKQLGLTRDEIATAHKVARTRNKA